MDGAIGIVELMDTARDVPRRLGRNYCWNIQELRLLDTHYPVSGLAGCLDLLPARSARAIYSMAAIRGLKAPGVPAVLRRRYAPNEHIDAAIRRCWETGPALGAVAHLSRTIGRTRAWITARALKLGLSAVRVRQPAWTAAEDEFMRARATQTPIVISRSMRAAGYRRTATAVLVRLKRLHVSRVDPELMTAREVGSYLGVDSHVVTRWIAHGLRAERRGTDRTEAQGGDMWAIRRKPLRDWIAENPHAVNLRKVADPEWFIDLLVRP